VWAFLSGFFVAHLSMTISTRLSQFLWLVLIVLTVVLILWEWAADHG
jgi:hypothetical protein